MFNFGRNVAATQFVWFFYSQADAFIVGKFLGKHDLGVYSVSMDLASLPASRLSSILNQVAFPSLSKVKRDGGAVGPYLLTGMRIVSLISFPVMWGMSCVAPELVRVLLGDKWTEAVLPLALLCLIMPLRVLSPLLHAGLHALGRADISFRITCITASAMCCSFLIGAQYGLLGLSLAWALVFPAVFLFNMFKSSKYLQLTNREIMAAPIRPALAGGLMYATVALTRQILQWSPTENLVMLVLAGASAYALFTIILNRDGLSEIKSLFLRPPKNGL
jgi:O-antigen/teichoic acid export membrane protein